MKKYLGILAAVLLVLTGAAVFYTQKSGFVPSVVSEPDSKIKIEPDKEGLGAELFSRSSNPLADELPETNPFVSAVNPLKEVYQNPFE